MFRVKVFWSGIYNSAVWERSGCSREGGSAGGVNVESHAFQSQCSSHAGEDCVEGFVLYEESFYTVAPSWVAGLGVDNGNSSLLLVGGGCEIDAAEAVCVAQDGDLCVVLDIPDKLVGAAGDDKINAAVLAEKLKNGVASDDELDG